MAFLLLLIRRINSFSGGSTPTASTQSYQKRTATSVPKKRKQKKLPADKLQKGVVAGEALWKRYETPEGRLKEPEQFWQRYEQLLQKVKKSG